MRYVRVLAITILSLAVSAPLQAATAAWDRNPEPDVTGYLVSYGTESGVHTTTVDVGNVTTYTFSPPVGQRYYIVVQAYNSSGAGPKSAEAILDLTTTGNLPPTLTQPANQTSVAGTAVPPLTLLGNDPEGRTLTYSATGLPPGLNVNSSTGVISGTPTVAGTFPVTATVSDGSLTASAAFTWTVNSPLSTPAPIGDTTPPTVSFAMPANNETVSGKNVRFRATASDPQGIAYVRYLINGNFVSNEIRNAPYQYGWDSTAVTDGTYQVTVRAWDTHGNAATATISVIVKNSGGNGNGKNSVDAPAAESSDSDAGTGDGAANGEPTPDVSVAADFDGDGLSDPAVFTAMTGEWRLWLSSQRYAPSSPLVWGAQNDVPVPADYDGDKRADLAVFKPSTGTWSIVLSNSGNPTRLDLAWGRAGDKPAAFDYDNDGRADLALPRSGGFDILLSGTNYTSSVTVR